MHIWSSQIHVHHDVCGDSTPCFAAGTGCDILHCESLPHQNPSTSTSCEMVATGIEWKATLPVVPLKVRGRPEQVRFQTGEEVAISAPLLDLGCHLVLPTISFTTMFKLVWLAWRRPHSHHDGGLNPWIRKDFAALAAAMPFQLNKLSSHIGVALANLSQPRMWVCAFGMYCRAQTPQR